MNILLISLGIYPCVIGGVEVFNSYFAKELSKRGHNVYILTTCEHGWSNGNSINIIKIKKDFLLCRSFLIGSNMLLELIKIRKLIDIIIVPYTSNSSLAYVLLIMRCIFRLPYMVTIHGGGMYQWKHKSIHRNFFRFSNHIVAVSKPIKEEYEKRTGREIKVIPPLIPFKESEISKVSLRKLYGFNIDSKIVLSVGTVKEMKGSDIILDALLKLDKPFIKSMDIHLVYVGNGPLRSVLEKKVEENHLEHYVRFVGKIPHERVSDFYKLSDIYVIASSFEGTPITLLEAMFNGMPIIGANTTGINSLIRSGENGLLFKRGDIDELAAQIKHLITDLELCKRVSAEAKRDYYRGYTYEDVINDYVALANNEKVNH